MAQDGAEAAAGGGGRVPSLHFQLLSHLRPASLPPPLLCLPAWSGWVVEPSLPTACLLAYLWSAYLLPLHLITALPPPSGPLFCLPDCGDWPDSGESLHLYASYLPSLASDAHAHGLPTCPMLRSAPPPLLYIPSFFPPFLRQYHFPPLRTHHIHIHIHPPTCCRSANLPRARGVSTAGSCLCSWTDRGMG